MAAFMDILKNGEKEIGLTEHSIKNVKFDSDIDINLSPKLHSVFRNLIVEGLINTDKINEPPSPKLDEYGDQVIDEDGEPEFELREIDSVRKLANWSIVPEYDECYCDVTISLTDARGEVVKTEEFVDMFVIDYKESFDNSHGNGSFFIHMREREAIEEESEE